MSLIADLKSLEPRQRNAIWASSSGVSGLSLAPKSTVPALICAIPPPDPIDW